MKDYEEWETDDDYVSFKPIKQKPKYNNAPNKVKDKNKRKHYKKAREAKNDEQEHSW